MIFWVDLAHLSSTKLSINCYLGKMSSNCHFFAINENSVADLTKHYVAFWLVDYFWQIAFLVSFQRIFAQIESDVMPHLIWTSTRILKKCQIFACICYIERVYRFKRLAQEIDARAISYLCEIIFPLHFNAEGFKVGNHRISTDASSATTSAKGRKSTSTYKLCKAMWHSQGKSTCKEGRKKKNQNHILKYFSRRKTQNEKFPFNFISGPTKWEKRIFYYHWLWSSMKKPYR